jgi:hypothetical protein
VGDFEDFMFRLFALSVKSMVYLCR